MFEETQPPSELTGADCRALLSFSRDSEVLTARATATDHRFRTDERIRPDSHAQNGDRGIPGRSVLTIALPCLPSGRWCCIMGI